jgi:hypothetical protein
MPITDQRTTLEAKHKEHVQNMMQNKEKMENINKIKKLKASLDYEKDLSKRREIQNKIMDLEEEQANIKETIDYMLDVLPVIQKYSLQDTQEEKSSKTSALDEFITTTKNKDKGRIYDEFLNITENQSITSDYKCSYTCQKCNMSRILSLADATMICPHCGDAEINFEMGSNNISYDQEISSDVNVCFAYKRINHFNEWMAQFQAKESTDIPQEILDNLRTEFRKARIINTKDITQKKVKEFLKKLKYNKFYEHVPHITNLLNGINPPSMSPQLEETLRNMFRDIQEPFEKHKPKGRSNFLSYGYCLYKFCELLGHDEFLDSFPLLKSREKLYQQDCIFKNICNELGWEFVPTI